MGAIEAGLAIAGSVLQVTNAQRIAKSRQRALDLQEKEIQVQSQQRSLALTRRVNQVMSQQAAVEASSGFSSASPSFGAITQDTIDEYAQDENANKLNESFSETNIAQERANVNDEEEAQIGGSLFDAARVFGESSYPGEFDFRRKARIPRYGGTNG